MKCDYSGTLGYAPPGTAKKKFGNIPDGLLATGTTFSMYHDPHYPDLNAVNFVLVTKLRGKKISGTPQVFDTSWLTRKEQQAAIWCWYLDNHPTGGTWIPRPWYRHKTTPSFLDALAALRRVLWSQQITATTSPTSDNTKISEALLNTLAYAA